MAVDHEEVLGAAHPLAGRAADAQKHAARHEALKKRYGMLKPLLGIPAAVLAGIAGVTATAGASTWITATTAFVSAALGAANTFLKPAVEHVRHGALADRY